MLFRIIYYMCIICMSILMYNNICNLLSEFHLLIDKYMLIIQLKSDIAINGKKVLCVKNDLQLRFLYYKINNGYNFFNDIESFKTYMSFRDIEYINKVRNLNYYLSKQYSYSEMPVNTIKILYNLNSGVIKLLMHNQQHYMNKIW